MKVHVLMEPALGPQLPAAVVPIATYGELHPGSSRVPVCLYNISTCAMEIPAKTVVGQVIPANQVPWVVHPTRTAKETITKAPLENIMATHPLELVHLDYLCLEPGKGLEENVLVITDHFARYAQAYFSRTQMAQIMAKTL